MSLVRAFVLKTAAMKPVERMVRHSKVFRSLVRRFIAGDTLEEAIEASKSLLGKGLMVTLDMLGENTKSVSEADQATASYIEMLDRISAPDVQDRAPRGLGVEPINISIKLTQCGLDLGREIAEANYHSVLERSRQHGGFVRIDMEGSDYTERTIEIVTSAFERFGGTGTVLQSYLRRTPQDVETMIRLGCRIRLVKGAYLEPASVAIPEKAKVDEAYLTEAKRLLEAGKHPAIATHDEKIIGQLLAFVAERKIDKSSFEFQMLYGIRRDLQERLSATGHLVRVYVPFGDAWYPYFTRRLAERPANALFILKSLLRR